MKFLEKKQKSRRIMHLDLDAFFAAVEERDNPKLKGKPIIVGQDPKAGKGRGVVSTANYEARKYGIRSGMPISIAWRKCPEPQCVYLPVNMPLYAKVSAQVMKILRKHADKFEQGSIDEAWLDVSKRAKNFLDAKKLAEKIKKELREKEKLTCSIGIAPNKLVAKIASDFKKPDGLTIVTPQRVQEFLRPLGVRKLPGVGPKTEAALKEMGIETIGQLARANMESMQKYFGVWGPRMVQAARGIDISEVEEVFVIKSVGRQATFDKDATDKRVILAELDKLAEETYQDVVAYGLFFKTVTVIMRYKGFETHTFAKTLAAPTNKLEDIKRVARELAAPRIGPDRPVRLVGVRLSNLVFDHAQRRLFRYAGQRTD